MKLRSRLTGTALVLTLSTFGLAACGGSDSGGDDTDTKDTSSQTDDTKTDDTDKPDDGGEDGKPSKEEVVDGYTKLVGKLAGDTKMPGDIVEKVVTCFVDEVYDDASAQTLNAIATGDQAGINPDDASLFTDATATCQKAALG